jgi:pimeloyl-ACP methyl ester carboxylesterase
MRAGFCRTSSLVANLGLCLMLFTPLAHTATEGPSCELWLEGQLPVDKINYKLTGPEDAETIVFMHGLGSALESFKHVAPELSHKFRVLVYDQRGHGKTPAVGNNYSTTVMAKDLKALVDHLGIKKFHLLGHSVGVRSALRFASLYPEMVKSLTLEDLDVIQKRAPARYEHAEESAARMRAELPDSFASKADMKKALIKYGGGWGKDDIDFVVNEKTTQNSDGTWRFYTHPDVLTLYDAQTGRETLNPLLNELRMPVLVMHGNPEMGSGITKPGLDSIRSRVQNLEVHEFRSAGHVIQTDSPQEFVEVLSAFVEKAAHE